MTLKQELFINIYLQTLNGTEAAFQVYNCKNRASASQIAYNLLRNVDIFAAVRYSIEANGLSLESIAEDAIKSLIEISKVIPTNINASESIRANQFLLKIYGIL